MEQTLIDLIHTRQQAAAHLAAIDRILAEQAKPLWQAHVTTYLTDCTLARASTILTEANRFLEDRNLPPLNPVSLARHLHALGFVKVRRADANYWRLR